MKGLRFSLGFAMVGASTLFLAPAFAAPPLQSDDAPLATISQSGGRTVIFREVAPGVLSVSETAPLGQPPLLGGANAGLPTDIYRALSNGAEPPVALKEAEARYVATPRSSAVPPRPTSAPEGVEDATAVVRSATEAPAILRPQNTSTQQWFTQTLCTGPDVGDTVLNPTEGEAMSWTLASNYDAYAFADASSPEVRLWGYTDEYYNGTWQWTQNWKSNAIAPGTYWHEVQWSTGLVWRYASLYGGGGSPDGMCEWQRDPTISYASWTNGRVYFAGVYPNDTSVNVYLGNTYVGDLPVNSGSFNDSSGWAPVCKHPVTNQAFELSITGDQTGQNATFPVTLTGCW